MTEQGPGRRFAPDFLTELFRNPLDPGYADAAARRAEGYRRPPRTRAALRGTTLAVLTLLGFLFVVAYKQTLADQPQRSATRAALVEQVQGQRTNTDALQARADQLRGEVADLRERELDSAEAARLRTLEGAAGLSRVRGDGVTVTVGDGRPTISPQTGQQTDDGRVRDFELQQIVNALWAEGAEAVAVNGQRLTATSTIREAGEAILVDRRPVASPYELVAIGPGDLAESFEAGRTAQAFRQLARQIGMTFEVKQADGVTLAPAAEPELRFATPSPAPSPAGGRSAPSSTPSEGGR
ncbi:DUF881 domain-containing protein [Spirilliplanes yamanashiensis]|uniref:Membrane protein n=1 Tax=Spirilliplanes yamanashiensis TaxID=42233 RepID=A0A8J3YA94_9ACTN|nr:DUF881 domain-containing protein [Spirilliplanes yamanashiensis]MDP9817964.1 uncharacterized protein YlxW (UPF0749 family) [Spirilliplanes yamanashiensis]GIJ04773.1 membrane protein [Spirilliplanes yamanashiensis]